MKYGPYSNNEMDGNRINPTNVIRPMPRIILLKPPPLCVKAKSMQNSNQYALNQSSNAQDEVDNTPPLHERCPSSAVRSSSPNLSTNSILRIALSSTINGTMVSGIDVN